MKGEGGGGGTSHTCNLHSPSLWGTTHRPHRYLYCCHIYQSWGLQLEREEENEEKRERGGGGGGRRRGEEREEEEEQKDEGLQWQIMYLVTHHSLW